MVTTRETAFFNCSTSARTLARSFGFQLNCISRIRVTKQLEEPRLELRRGTHPGKSSWAERVPSLRLRSSLK